MGPAERSGWSDLRTPSAGPAGGPWHACAVSSDRWVRLASYALVLVLTLLLAVWGAFLVPLRIGTVPVPLGLLLALAVVPLGLAGGRLLGQRLGVAGPVVVWLLVASLLSSQRREGDLVITNSTLGVGFLLLGLLGAAFTVGVWRPPASPARRSGRDTPGGGVER